MALITPRHPWTPFRDAAERQKYLRLWGFPRKTETVYYRDRTSGELLICEVVGYRNLNDSWAIIQISEEIGCIHSEYLRSMQPKKERRPKPAVQPVVVPLADRLPPFRRYISGPEHIERIMALIPSHLQAAAWLRWLLQNWDSNAEPAEVTLFRELGKCTVYQPEALAKAWTNCFIEGESESIQRYNDFSVIEFIDDALAAKLRFFWHRSIPI